MLSGQYNRREDASTISLPEPFGQLNVGDESSYIYQAKLTQPLFNPSAQRYETRAASLQAKEEQLKSQSLVHRATGQALINYYNLLTLKEVAASLLSLEKSLASRADRIRKQVDAGRALKTDQLQVEVALNRVAQQQIENTSEYQNQLTRLKLSLGLSNQANILIAKAKPAAAVLELDTLEPELSCYQRLDCQAAELQTKRAGAVAQSISAGYWPKVNLSLTEVRSDGQLFVPESDRQAMLEFSWSLFSGGQRKSKRKAANARENAQLRELTTLKEQIELQITRANSSLTNANSQLSLARASLELDTERLRLSRKRYESGLLNVDELLDAEASLAKSETDLARAQLQQLIARTQIKLASGQKY